MSEENRDTTSATACSHLWKVVDEGDGHLADVCSVCGVGRPSEATACEHPSRRLTSYTLRSGGWLTWCRDCGAVNDKGDWAIPKRRADYAPGIIEALRERANAANREVGYAMADRCSGRIIDERRFKADGFAEAVRVAEEYVTAQKRSEAPEVKQ